MRNASSSLEPFVKIKLFKCVCPGAKDRLFAKPSVPLTRKITVRSDKRIYQIDLDEIYFIEACGDYTSVYYADKKLVTHETIKNWGVKLKGFSFQKIHRSIIINLQKIDHIEGNLVIIGKNKLSISEAYRDSLITELMARNVTRIG